jgi:hypothetical protein
MFGLPQALFYYVKAGRLLQLSALRWAASSAVLALAIGAVSSWARSPDATGATAGLVALAVALAVWHGQLRALLLVLQRTAWFNVTTALPQVLVLLGVVVAVAAGWVAAAAWAALFAVAFGCSALLARWRLNRHIDADVRDAVGWRELAHYGAAAWLTAALSTAAVLATQYWVEGMQGRVALGRFTMAMTLVQVPLTPISYAAPLLLRRWMERPGARAARRAAVTVFAALCLAAAAVGVAGTVWPDLGLGRAYAGATFALAVLLAGGAAEASSRVLTVHASASGLPWVGVRAEVVRWSVLAVAALMLDRAAPHPGGLLLVCAVWSLAAAAAAAVFVAHAHAAVDRAGAAS